MTFLGHISSCFPSVGFCWSADCVTVEEFSFRCAPLTAPLLLFLFFLLVFHLFLLLVLRLSSSSSAFSLRVPVACSVPFPSDVLVFGLVLSVTSHSGGIVVIVVAQCGVERLFCLFVRVTLGYMLM